MKDKLPEFTGDKLTAWGYESLTSWGTGLDSFGEVLNCGGNDSFECLYAAGEQSLDQDCRGCLYTAVGEVFEIYGRILNFLDIR